jgi:hypothetical protein
VENGRPQDTTETYITDHCSGGLEKEEAGTEKRRNRGRGCSEMHVIITIIISLVTGLFFLVILLNQQ